MWTLFQMLPFLFVPRRSETDKCQLLTLKRSLCWSHKFCTFLSQRVALLGKLVFLDEQSYGIFVANGSELNRKFKTFTIASRFQIASIIHSAMNFDFFFQMLLWFYPVVVPVKLIDMRKCRKYGEQNEILSAIPLPNDSRCHLEFTELPFSHH